MSDPADPPPRVKNFHPSQFFLADKIAYMLILGKQLGLQSVLVYIHQLSLGFFYWYNLSRKPCQAMPSPSPLLQSLREIRIAPYYWSILELFQSFLSVLLVISCIYDMSKLALVILFFGIQSNNPAFRAKINIFDYDSTSRPAVTR